MELEGFGVTLVGRLAWVHGAIPWEFLQSQHTLKVLIRGARPTLADAEQEWTCVWNPTHMRDWSCIATVLRGYQAASCMIVFDHVIPPGTFWGFLDGLSREGRTVTRFWIHEEPPSQIPDATFFQPTLNAEVAQRMLDVFSALPARHEHGPWLAPAEWLAVVSAAHEQGMGLVVTDLEETAWTLLWHRPADSRPPTERRIPTAQHWLRIGMQILDGQGL